MNRAHTFSKSPTRGATRVPPAAPPAAPRINQPVETNNVPRHTNRRCVLCIGPGSDPKSRMMVAGGRCNRGCINVFDNHSDERFVTFTFAPAPRAFDSGLGNTMKICCCYKMFLRLRGLHDMHDITSLYVDIRQRLSVQGVGREFLEAAEDQFWAFAKEAQDELESWAPCLRATDSPALPGVIPPEGCRSGNEIRVAMPGDPDELPRLMGWLLSPSCHVFCC